VESVLGRLDGVTSADADYLAGKAVVEYDPQKTTPAEIVEAFNSQTFFQASLPAGEARVGSSDAAEGATAGSLTGSESQGASGRSGAGPLYSVYVLFGLAALGLGALTWRVVRKRTPVERGIPTE